MKAKTAGDSRPGKAGSSPIRSLDQRLFVLLRTRGHPRVLELALILFSVSGNWGLFWLGLAAAFWLGGSPWEQSSFIALLIYLTLTINYAIKVALRRQRPATTDPRLKPLVEVPSSKSFPSSHAAMSFAAAAAFSCFHPSWWPLFFGLALVMSWSRVYVGVHYPSDVLAGTVVGLVMGGLAALFFSLGLA